MQNISQTQTDKTQIDAKSTNILTMFLFALTSVIYLATAAYSQFFTKNPDSGDVMSNIGLAIMFFCIGLSFLFIKSDK
jgi:hypothetical protein